MKEFFFVLFLSSLLLSSSVLAFTYQDFSKYYMNSFRDFISFFSSMVNRITSPIKNLFTSKRPISGGGGGGGGGGGSSPQTTTGGVTTIITTTSTSTTTTTRITTTTTKLTTTTTSTTTSTTTVGITTTTIAKLTTTTTIPKSGTIVSTELINFYSMTTSEVQTFIQLIDNQNIPLLVVRLNAMNEFQSGTSSGITKTKQVIQEANSRGIQVAIDLHTWYTTWDNYFRDSASNHDTYRSQYITYVRNVLSAFSDSNVYSFMVLNEPQARTATSSENQFILNIIDAAKQVTSKPISVRFMGGYSPTTGHYSSSIDQACDYISRTCYWDPRKPSVVKNGITEPVLINTRNSAHNQGKEFWIVEFGRYKDDPDLEEQRDYVENFVSWSKLNDIDAIFCWVSQPEGGSSERYNIFTDYTPHPAFYELIN